MTADTEAPLLLHGAAGAGGTAGADGAAGTGGAAGTDGASEANGTTGAGDAGSAGEATGAAGAASEAGPNGPGGTSEAAEPNEATGPAGTSKPAGTSETSKAGSTATPAEPRRRVGLGLAPGTAMLAMLVVNITIMSTTKMLNTIVCSALVLITLVSLRRPRLLLGVAGTVLVSAAIFALMLRIEPSGVLNLLGPLCFYVMKFTIVIAAGIYVLLTVRPSDMASFLYQIRAPRWLSTPLTVMLRFFPQARQEFLAVMEAMSLRGIPFGPRHLVLHPLRTIEHLLFPMLASCSRIADDLTASALVRGLGSDTKPTALEPMRFRWHDGAALAVLAGVIAIAASPITLGL